MPYGAFCILPEYNNLEAFLHISEVAPRWIKNIHEFISEGQRYVVKVHHVDREKNQVDVSIKRVNEEEKKRKLEIIKTEKRGEMLLDISLKASGSKVLMAAVQEKILSQFEDIYGCFREASEKGEEALASLDIPNELKAAIVETAKKNIKKAVVELSATATLMCYGPRGLDDVKKALKLSDASVHYLGAPRYKISLTAADYKSGEKKLDSVLEHIKAFAQKNNCDFSFARDE